MTSARLPLGIFTTDERLIIRTWDRWIANATGIEAGRALNRPLADVVPELDGRGLLQVVEQVVSRGMVQVLAPALHRYFIACPPAEPSAHFDRMQQHVTIGPLREEGRIVGAIVTIEDVTARMDEERRLKSLPPEALIRMLSENDWRVRRTAVATLAERGQEVVDALVQTLREQHTDFGVLSSILDLLAVSDVDIVEHAVHFLEDEDTNLRIQAALLLGEHRDRRAVPALIARLEDPDVNVRFHAIEALGRLQATEAADALVRIAERRDFFLAFPAVQALSALGSPAIAPRLVPLLADDLLRTPAIDTLGALGDEDVTVPLVRLLNSGEAPSDVVADALCGLHERYEHRYAAGAHIADLVRQSITPPGTQRILDSVEHVSSDRLPGLARVLSWLEGDAVQRALTRLLGRDAVRSQVVEALVRYGPRVTELLVEQLRAEDLETRQAAAVALGRIGDRRATPALVAALDDRELAVAAAGALARIGDRDAYGALITRLGEPDSSIRQGVIAALHSIGHAGMRGEIARLLGDADPIVRESAMRIAGYFGYPECLELALACCRDEAPAVRRTAIEHLPLFEDPRVFDVVADALASDVPAVRAAAAMALARIEHPGRVEALANALSDADAWVRYHAVRALGDSGEASAVSVVVGRLEEDEAPHVRLAAIDVLGRLVPAEAQSRLEPLTRSPDEDTARAAIRALGRVDQADVLAQLEGFLHTPEPWRRLAAVEALGRRGEVRVPEILQWLAATDGDAAIVGAAIDALAGLAARDGDLGAGAARALIALTAEPARREAAITALSGLPARRVGEIAAGLRHPVPDVRRATVEALSRMKQPEASRAVESALDDTVAAVRLTAVGELKRLGARGSQKKLLAVARTDPDREVRQAAILAVARSDVRGELGMGSW